MLQHEMPVFDAVCWHANVDARQCKKPPHGNENLVIVNVIDWPCSGSKANRPPAMTASGAVAFPMVVNIRAVLSPPDITMLVVNGAPRMSALILRLSPV